MRDVKDCCLKKDVSYSNTNLKLETKSRENY